MTVSKTVERVCEYCGGTFFVRCKAEPNRYCNRRCSRRAQTPPFEDRFWEKVDRNGPVPEHRPELGPCWNWTGAIINKKLGYSVIEVDGKLTYAHRVSYKLNVGPIPEGLDIDHLCRNRRCVNPAHLEPVTRSENVLRGMSPPAMAARSDRCGQGHLYTPESVYQREDGRRVCRACVAIWAARSRARRQAKERLA